MALTIFNKYLRYTKQQKIPSTGAPSSAAVAPVSASNGVHQAESGRVSQSVSTPPFSRSETPFGISEQEQNGNFQQNQEHAQAAIQNVVGLMKSLQSKQGGSQSGKLSNTPAGQTAKTRYSENELAEGLSSLQADSANRSEDSQESTSLISRVQDQLKSANGTEKGIDEDQQVAIDVVDRFFLSMRNNPRLSPEAKGHLLKLEVPVLKVLLKDENFFDDHNSSVRAVMNRIAQLGAKGSRLNPASSKKVALLVHKIVNEFEHDTQVFDYVLSELDMIIDRQNQLYVKNVERVAAAADGVHRVEGAKVAVSRD